jgi:hypothetical protein
MSRLALSIGLVTALAGWLVPVPAPACDLIGNTFHTIDPAMQGIDSQPPTLTPIEIVEVHRGHEVESNGCLFTQTCGEDLGSIWFAVTATDDMTPDDRIGYRLSIAAGTPPAGFVLPPALESLGTRVYVPWNDGASGDQEAFDVTFAVVAIDRAGNESAPQTFRAQHAGTGGGCRIAGRRGHPLGLITFALLAGLAVTLRKRCSQRSRVVW